jgi:S-(hydroxymethyl)glutathione dehydrogenase/alcohol dehydrogenase
MNRLVSEAAVLSSFHKRIEIRQVVVPRLLPKQVLVRIIYASICGSQIFEWRGQRNNEKWLPHMFGHEAYGEVVEAEDCATWIKKGERVIVSWLTNGLETGEAPIYYDQEKNRINAGKCAIFSQYAVVTQDKIFRIPGNIDPRVAPLFGCSIPTGAGMVVLFSAGNSDSRVLVRGFGGVGMAASICLRKLGVREIFVDDISIERKEKSSAMGFSLLDSGAREESFT